MAAMHPLRLLRNRLLGASRRLVRPAAEWREAQRVPVVELAQVQRRLELLLAAMYGHPMRVVASSRSRLAAPTEVALPPRLPGGADAIEAYRLLAVQQGARLVRGTRRHAPVDPLARDVYLVLEAAAIDAEIAERAPGLVPALHRLRAEALAARPGLRRLVPQQREVEQLLRAVLSSDPLAPPPHGMPRTESPAASADAAVEIVARMRAATRTRVQYRSVPAVTLWDDPALATTSDVDLRIPVDSITLPVVVEGDDEPSDEGTESDRWEPGGDVADDTSPGSSDASGTTKADVAAADADALRDAPPADGILYPEWIERQGRMEPRRVTVREVPAAERDDAWARDALHEHGPLLRRVRDRFALLRAHRLRLRAQRSGDELDLDACVAAQVDGRIGRVPSDRLYQTTRATRHALAITVLVDVSGSTKTQLPDGRSVLDVERLSLLLASEALDALGDRYSIVAFSGLGRHDVRVACVKGFGDHDRGAVHRRISSLNAQDNTRLGAAVRHAAARLTAQPARRHVLLILSDGRPNDVDHYQGIDAIEDSRQAVLAARAEGVLTFCLTVDTEEADYLPHLFGEGGYRVISDPAQLPGALLRLVDRLLRG